MLNFLRSGDLPPRERVRAVHKEAQYYAIGPLLEQLENVQPLKGEKVRQAFLGLMPYYKGEALGLEAGPGRQRGHPGFHHVPRAGGRLPGWLWRLRPAGQCIPGSLPLAPYCSRTRGLVRAQCPPAPPLAQPGALVQPSRATLRPPAMHNA